jgi:phasin
MANTDPFSASVIPFEVPEQMRAFAEKGVSQARDSYAKFKDAAETHNGTIEAVFTTASKGASEYSTKLMEMMKSNSTATLDFAQELLGVKSPTEAMELWTSHAKKQFEAFTANTKELTELSQKVAAEPGLFVLGAARLARRAGFCPARPARRELRALPDRPLQGISRASPGLAKGRRCT